MSNIDKDIGKRLFLKLNASGKTQAELAEFLGVTQASVSNWVNGIKLPRMDKIDKICAFLNCSRSSLLIGDTLTPTEDKIFDYYYSLLSVENQKRTIEIMKAFLAAQEKGVD